MVQDVATLARRLLLENAGMSGGSISSGVARLQSVPHARRGLGSRVFGEKTEACAG